MGRKGALVWVALVAVAAAVQWAPSASQRVQEPPAPRAQRTVPEPAPDEGAPRTADEPEATPPTPSAPDATDCRDPSPERGVSARAIRLGSVAVQSGPGASFEGEAPAATQAVVREANAAGGVCGRLLALRMRDAGWDPQRGSSYFWDMVEHGLAAFLGIDSRSLAALLADGSIDDAAVPVIGTPGLADAEFTSGWIWPVAPRRDAYGWASVAHGYRAGARTFAVVYDPGDEASVAVLRGARAASADRRGTRVHAQPVYPGRPSYSAEIDGFGRRCDPGCDVVVLAVPPSTSLTWLAGRPRPPAMHYTAIPEYLDERFGSSCGSDCDGLIAWSPFELPGAADPPADVRALARDHPVLDTTNIAVLAAFVGARVAVDALASLDEALTHEALRAALDAGSFPSVLTKEPLSWGAARTANRWVRGYRLGVDPLGRVQITRATGWLEPA